MSTKAISLTRYLQDHEAERPELGSEFCHLMAQLAFAAKLIARKSSGINGRSTPLPTCESALTVTNNSSPSDRAYCKC